MASSAFKAYLMLIPKMDSSSKSKVKSELDGIDVESSGTKLGTAFGKKMLAAFAALGVASAIANIVKQSVQAYGEYEQLVGGVEKIFDTMDQSAILADASNAWRDLNMSANDYLSAINDVGATFSATMGDAKGYETARTGLKAISDYASGTGKNIDLLSEKFALISRSTSSYQSIADQFSGILPQTSADFLEQAQAAGYLSDEYTSLTQVPVAEYQQALTKMLEKGVDALGLAGNTAAETANTLTGSIAGMFAAWENFLTAIAAGDAEKAAQDLVQSVGDVLKNLIPVIAEIIEQLIIMLPDLIMMLVPVVLDAVAQILLAIAVVLYDLWTVISEFFANLWNDIVAFLSGVTASINGFFIGIVEGIGSFFIGIIEGIASFISSVIESIVGLIDSVVSFFTSLWGTLTGVASGIWASVSGAFSSGVESAISFVASLPGRVLSIFAGVGSWLVDSGRSLIKGFIDGITGAIDWAADTVSNALSRVRDLFPFSPAKEGPFSGKGWTLYSGMAIAESLGEGFDRQIDRTIAKVNQSMGSLHSAVAIDAGSALSGRTTNIYINGARINDDSALEDAAYRFLTELNHLATTEGVA